MDGARINSQRGNMDMLNSHEGANEIEASEELVKIVDNLVMNKPESILKLGLKPALEILKLSDKLLKLILDVPEGDSEILFGRLNDIMSDFQGIYPSTKRKFLLNKLKSTVMGSIKTPYKQFVEIGNEIDKVYVRLKQYRSEIRSLKHNLDEMSEEYCKNSQQLELYFQAGKLVLCNWKNDLKRIQDRSTDSIDIIKQMDRTLKNDIEMLELRMYDLRVCKIVALQTTQQIEILQIGTNELLEKINSALISTIPVFRQSILQIAAYEKQVEENVIEIAALESAEKTLTNGIDEAIKIQVNLKEKRSESIKKLHEFKEKLK